MSKSSHACSGASSWPGSPTHMPLDAVGIAGEIAQHLLGSCERVLAVDNPLDPPQWREERLEGSLVGERSKRVEELQAAIRSRLREAKVGFGGLALVGNVVQVRLSKPEDAESAVRALGDLALTVPTGLLDRLLVVMRGSLESDIIVAKGEGGIITISATGPGLERRTRAALDNTLAIVSRRLDGMGIAASAERRERDRIYVHAPSLQETPH